MDNWKLIESAPKDGTPIICAEYNDGHGRWDVWQDYWRKYLEPFGEGFGSINKPTHWTTLPVELQAPTIPFSKMLKSMRGPLSQESASRIIKRPLRTIQSWESGRRVPDIAIQNDVKNKLHKHFESL